MRSALVCVALALLVCYAATASADTAGWGAWSSCSKLCDGGVQTRTCTNPTLGCDPTTMGTQTVTTSSLCNVQPCLNCTVTPFWWNSGCTKQCGGGTYWTARQITQQPTAGGTPCPQLNYTLPCNTYMCQGTIQSYGYATFGPLKGGPLTYTFTRGNEDIDVFLFDQKNYIQYQYDAARTTPYQTNYAPLAASLDIDTTKTMGPIVLDPAVNYYLVVDHTYIGAATGTNTGNGFVFNPNTFYFFINGVDYGTPAYSGTVGLSAASSSASVSAMAVVAVAVLAAKLL